MATERKVLVGPVNGTYGSLEAAEAAEQGDISAATGSDEYVWFEVEDFDDTTRAGFSSGWTVESPNNYILVKPKNGAKHDGRARDVSGSGYALKGIDMVQPCGLIYLEDLVLYEPTTSGSQPSTVGLTVGTWNSGDTVTLKRCIIQDKQSAATTKYAISASQANLNLVMENCIIYGNNRPIDARSAASAVLKHCTFYGGSALGPILDNSCTVDNCYSGGHTSQDWWTGGTAPSGDYNASEDTTATTDYTNGINSLAASSQFNNASLGTSADFRLKSGAGLIDAGGTGLGVTDDIEGQTRDASPDIGASEYLAAGGSFSGTSALTLSSLSIAAGGTNTDPSFSGSSAISLSSMVPAAAGTNADPSFSGSSALTLSSMVPAAAGTNTDPVYSGAAALAFSSAILAAAGTNNDPGFQGASALVLSSMVAAMAGTNTDPVYSGAAALALSSAILAAAGTNNDPGYQGASALSLSSLVPAAAGTYAAPDRTGASALTLASAILAAAGTNNDPGNQGQIALALASLVPASAGTYTPPDRTAASAILLGALSASAAGTVLPPVFSGSIGQELSPLDLAAAGVFSSGASGGSIAQVLSSLELGFVGDYTPPPIAGAVALDLASLVFGIAGTLDPLLPTYARLVTLEAVTRTLTLDRLDRTIRLD